MADSAPGEPNAEVEQAELRQLAVASGARVLQTNIVDVNGKRTSVIELDVAGNAKAIVFLNALARHDTHHPKVRTLGLQMRREHGDVDTTAPAIMEWVKANVSFVLEEDEVFQHSAYTMDVGAGDCDDHARLVCALLMAAGFLHSRIVGVSPPGSSRIAHVCAQTLRAPGDWAWCETTVDAHYRENPFDAVRRLGLGKKRVDITQGAT